MVPRPGSLLQAGALCWGSGLGARPGHLLQAGALCWGPALALGRALGRDLWTMESYSGRPALRPAGPGLGRFS